MGVLMSIYVQAFFISETSREFMASEHIGNMDVVQEFVHTNSKDGMSPT